MNFRSLVFFLVLSLCSGQLFAVIKTSNGGNWNTAGTWSPAGVPLATDDVVLASGTTNVNATRSCNTLTMNGTAILNFPTNNLTLTVNSTMTMNGNTQITGNNNNRVLNLLGDFNIPAGQSASIGGVNVTQSVPQALNLAGTLTPTDNTGTKTFGHANLYDGCLLDATVTEGINITGNLTVNPALPGQHSKIGRVNVTVSGTTTVTGYLEFANSGTGTKTFNNTITVAAGGTWDNIVGEDPVINCSIVNNGVWPQPTGGNGRYNVNVAGTYTYSGTKQITMTRLRIQSASTVTNLGSLKLTKTNSDALTVNSGGTFNNGDGVSPAYLTLSGEPDLVLLGGGGSTVNFANPNNTVDYAGPFDQNVYATTYDKLICSGNNTTTVNGSTVVNTAMTISGSTIVDVSGGTDLTGTGNLTMTGTTKLRLSSSGTVPALTGAGNSLAAGTTIEFYRAGAQTAASSANYPYQNVIISGNGGSAVNMNTVSNIAGDFTLTNAGSFNNALNTPALITVAGNFSYGSSAATVLNTALNAASVSISSGTFIYNDQTITLSQDNAFWSVTGAPVITSTGGAGNATVVFTSGLNQQIAGTTNPSFNNLTINNANDVTINVASVTVNKTLTLTSGMLTTGTNVVVIPSAASVTRTSGYVNGNLNKAYPVNAGATARTFEIGTATGYAPATFTLTAVTGAGTLTVSTTDGDHPDINSGLIEPNHTVNRYWSLTNNAITFSAFSTGRIAASFNWVNADEDALLANTAIVKWYDNTALSWTGEDQFDTAAEQNPPMTLTMNVATNTLSFTLLDPAQLISGRINDFQIGDKIDPTFVYNRVSGAANWNNLATWIQQRSGVITLVNGNPIITGASTTFQSELVVNDNIMLISSPGTVYTVTAINPVLQQITVSPAPAISTSGGYGRQYIPGINSPTSDVDAVVIGNTNIADAATTITLDISAQILTLDVGTTTRTTSHALTHQNSTRTLTVLANAAVNMPGAPATNAWNINAGTADVQGDLTIGTGTNNTLTRISQVNITTGTLDIDNLKFKPAVVANGQQQTILNLSGAGTVNLHGALTFTGSRGTLTSVAGSTFNYVRSGSGQTITAPANSLAAWAYPNLHVNNTSAAGAVFGFTSTAALVTGNLRVQTGKMSVVAFDIVGAAGSTFQVAAGATFEMKSTSNAGVGGFPSGFGTITLGPTSTVAYNQTGNTNPWPVRSTTYGNLIVGQNASTRNFQLANATTNVAGDLTIGTTTSTPNLSGTGSAVFNITGDVLINNNAVLDATNITTLTVGGDWTDNGTFVTGNNTVTFNSPAANVLQIIGGTTSEAFYNLTINTSATTDIVQLSGDLDINNTLTLTQGGLSLNSTTINVNRSATGAVVRTGGYLKSEDIGAPYGTLNWFINNQTGTFTYPFGKSATEYIPVLFNVTSAGSRGVGSGYVPISTYATAATNPPGEYPATVNNLNGTTGGASVTDRYWVITIGSTEFATTRPTATVTFTALNTEKPTTWTAIGEPPTNPNQLLAQRWNTANYWDPAQTVPAQTYANNSPAAGTFQVGVPGMTNYSQVWTITDSSVPLPIQLTDFTAQLKGSAVQLNWRTETELDNDYFTVQRTFDGESFEEVTRVKGAGTSTKPNSYASYDNSPQPGKWYYRLKQTDTHGTFSYSKLVSVVVPEELTWVVYPNPSEGAGFQVKFATSDVGKAAYLQLQDINGKQVHQYASPGLESTTVRVDLPQPLSPGVYLVTISVDNHITHQKMVVK